MMIPCKSALWHFVIHGEESEVEEVEHCQSDKVYRWFLNMSSRRYSLPPQAEEKVEQFSVCAVQEMEKQMLIVLDSGADCSLLPKSMSSRGRNSGGGKAVLEDAQGGRLRTYGRKIAQIECEGSHEMVIIEDDFVVASVQTPLISLGRLLQRGWRMVPGDCEAGVHLQAPDLECQIPLRFKKNSLALLGTIRRILHEPDEQEGGSGSGHRLDDDEVLVIQTVLQLHSKFWENYGLRAWKTTPEGNPVRFSYDSKNFVNCQLIWNLNWWPLRSTLIRRDDDTWEVVEHCSQYYTHEEPDGEIPECQGVETQVLTVLHRRKEPLAFFGTIVGEQTVTAGGVDVDSHDFQFATEPMVPQELDPGQMQHPEETDQVDVGGSWDGPMPWFENKELLQINGQQLSERSSLAHLREAAEFLGLGRGGSKATLWTRLNQEIQKMEHREMFVIANRLYKEQNKHKGLVAIRAPRQPSNEERELHELTHVPYRDWCDFCVACKGKSDPQRSLDKSEEGRRSIPGIQLDYAFGRSDQKNQEELVVILVGVDAETRMLLAVPVESKGADLRGQAEHVVRFTLALNHYGNTEIIGDSEPTMKALLTYVKSIRHSLGLETTITNSMKKGQTGRVERAIATLRKQASTLMEMAESKCMLHLEGSHAMWYWSYLHAAWILNRFGVHSALSATPFELAYGRRYMGKVVCFGEYVLLLHRQPGMKQGPQWLPGIWVGKTNEDDLHLVIGVNGVMKGKAVRRTSEPWRPTYMFLVKDKPFRNPGVKRPPLRIMPSTPMVPRGVRGPGRPRKETQEASDSKHDGEAFMRDQDADDVERYAREHGGRESPVEETGRGEKRQPEAHPETEPSKYVRVPPLPMGLDEAGERVPQTPEMKRPQTPRTGGEMQDEGDVEEPKMKTARTSPEGSPTHLYAPTFAGNINVASRPVDEEPWEQELEEYSNEGGGDWPLLEVEELDEGHPPELSEEELQVVEEEAGQEEIHRLLQMGVLREPTDEELSSGTVLTTRSVFDWRFREQRWKRRCRFVAREFRAGDSSNAKTFAPTSSLSATRLLLATHALLSWKLTFIDVKDAFLLVDQVKLVLVEKPQWWQPEELEQLHPGERRFWTLLKCLPGQRDAAARWYDHLTSHLEEIGFQHHLSLPSLFRHESKPLAAVCHVDDLIVAGEECSIEWLLEAMRSRFVLSESGILPKAGQQEDEPVRCLKKRHYFTANGIVIMPHEKYIPSLMELYKLEHRGGRATPESTHVSLEGPPEDVLDGESQFRFRSALGTLLYISQDRIDIQHSVRNLSQFMARPTKLAEAEVKHVILYLKRTEGYGLLLPYQKCRSEKAEILGQVEELNGPDILESFTDSDWAGDQSSAKRRRHSVSSTFIFLNGCLVISWSRSQKSIALSSCEAEFLAAAGGCAEGLQVKDLWSFISKREVILRAITDSSSCRAFSERLGVGRLKHIDTRYLWVQLEIKKESLSMEGIPTLWNVADLGTKRLTKVRREFLMYLIGLVEMDAMESEEKFAKVGEESFHHEMAKKMMTRRMKEVKREMMTIMVQETSEASPKIPNGMVKMVTLLLLQPVAFGSEDGRDYDKDKENYQSGGGLVYFFMFVLYSMIVFAFGMICGYLYRTRIGIFLRTVARLVRQERTNEFIREQEHQDALENYRSYRGMIVRSMMDGVPGGEWQVEPRRRWPEPLQYTNDEVPDRIMSVQLRGGVNEEEDPPAANEPEPEGEDDDNEEEAEDSDSDAPRPGFLRDHHPTTMDWNPELGRMWEYRVLSGSDSAESGEEFFVEDAQGTLHRRYRPTTSERNDEDLNYENMEVDDTGEPSQASGEAIDRENPPEDADWWDMETLLRYQKEDNERRARKVLSYGLFPETLFKEFLRTRLAADYTSRFPHMAFDHILQWTNDERKDFALFAVMVCSTRWEADWDGNVRRFMESGEV